MKKTLLLLLLAAGAAAGAAQLKDFTPYDASRSKKVILSDSFESRHKQLKRLPKEFELKRGYGQNATGGLRLKRLPGGRYSYPFYDVKLKPGTHYQLSVDVRADGLRTNDGKVAPAKRTAMAGVDFTSGRKHVAGFYVFDWPNNGNIDWKTYTLDFHTPAKFTDAKPALFLSKHLACVGGVYWDNFSITEMGETVPVIFPVLPKTLHPDAEGNLKFRVHDFNSKRDEKSLILFAVVNGGEFSSDVKNGFAYFKIGKLPAGEHQIKLYLADRKQKAVICEEQYLLFSSTKKAPAGAVTMAEDSRILVDGKPFFPVGFYFERTSRINPFHLKQLKEAGVNTILTNKTFSMRVGQKTKKYGLDTVRKSLDYLHKYDIKVIMSMLEFIGVARKRIPVYAGIKDNFKQAEYLVKNLWDHPAILAWYVSDENPVEELGLVRNLRYAVSRHDPFHPVATLTDNREHYVYFGATGDFLMSDRYPIIYKKDPQSMHLVHESLERALTHGNLGNWFVPQCFNWGIYKRHEKYELFRYPTELEIRSQCLAALNHRVRGIIFYAYDAFIRQEENDPENGSYKEHWPRTANVIKLIRELEPFFMSLEKPVDLKIDAKGNSKVEAVRHSANGKEIVVITSDGPGNVEAIIDAGRTGLKSRFGFTEELGGGKYRFKSVEIASDILE